MGQFDSPSEAALQRLKSESLSESPIDKVAFSVVGIGSIILELAGMAGAASLAGLIKELGRLAANKDEGNLIYFAEALVDDIRRLYRQNDETRRIVDAQLKSKEFHETVANATLHITRTNVETRLKRVALLITNGVRLQDLERESLDDMMRIAVELKEQDIQLLQAICNTWESKSEKESGPGFKLDAIEKMWKGFDRQQSWTRLSAMGALTRLQAHGLIHSRYDGEFNEAIPELIIGVTRYILLEEGKIFFERIQEIAAN